MPVVYVAMFGEKTGFDPMADVVQAAQEEGLDVITGREAAGKLPYGKGGPPLPGPVEFHIAINAAEYISEHLAAGFFSALGALAIKPVLKLIKKLKSRPQPPPVMFVCWLDEQTALVIAIPDDPEAITQLGQIHIPALSTGKLEIWQMSWDPARKRWVIDLPMFVLPDSEDWT